MDELRRAYPNVLEISLESRASPSGPTQVRAETVARESVEDLFSRFYREMTGEELSDYQRRLLSECAYLCGGDCE